MRHKGLPSPSLRQGEKRRERRLKRISKPFQKRLMLFGCLLSQKFDKILLHHLTLNGFAKAAIGLNIPSETRQSWLRKCLLLPNRYFCTYIWPCSGRSQTEHLQSALQAIKVKSWNLMCPKHRSYKIKSRCVPKTN